jgi:deazaflavin-dependent oxidoreductase (nitroreductase family)
MDAIHDGVCRRFGGPIASGQVVVLRARSAEAADQVEPLDWVYIDGDHTYHAVKADLKRFYQLLKPGGVIAGDDYAMAGWWEDGVTRAVDEFVASHGITPTFLGHQFLFTRPATSDDAAAASGATAIREAAMAEAPKHRQLLRSPRDGRILSAIMLPFFAVGTPPGYAVLTTTGRKSGKQRRKCIRVARRRNKAFIVQLRPPEQAIERPTAVAAWVWNLRANPNVRLRIGRGTYAGTAREIDDPLELAQAREALCETVHLIDYDECALHLRGLPTRDKIKALHRYWFDTGIPIVVELNDRDAR